MWHWIVVNRQNIKQGKFLWKNHAKNVHQKLVTESFLILGNKTKDPFYAKNPFWEKIF